MFMFRQHFYSGLVPVQLYRVLLVKSYLILIQEVKMDGLLPQQSDQNQYILKLFMILFIYLVVL